MGSKTKFYVNHDVTTAKTLRTSDKLLKQRETCINWRSETRTIAAITTTPSIDTKTNLYRSPAQNQTSSQCKWINPLS